MYEVLNFYREKINSSTILETLKLKRHNYFAASIHREENVDNPRNLLKVMGVLNSIASAFNLPVIVSTHPRTRKRLEYISDIKVDPQIQFLKPFAFTDYVNLQMNALCTISDSGTISEESAILNFPALSLRNSMERPEAQDAGTVILTGFDPDVIMSSIRIAVAERARLIAKLLPVEYIIPDTSWRTVKLIMGLQNLSNKWHGIQ